MSELRAPFGWPMLRIEPGESLRINPAAPATPAPAGGWLRVTVSVDDREEKLLSVRLPSSARELGVMDLRFAHSLEPFHLALSADDYAEAARDGIVLTLTKATCALQLLASDLPPDAAPLAPVLVPEVETDRLAAFSDRLASRASVQAFGWMEGCVLDALHDLHVATGEPRWRAALDAHFALFVTPDHRLVYEDPRGRPSDGVIYGIEGALPFAQLAKIAPTEHPLLGLALRFFREKLAPDGGFAVPESITAEGSYTIAYPLAVLAQTRRDRELARLSANVLRVRRESLRRPDGLWLRHHVDDTRTFRSWARGVAWYLLGLVRSIEHLGDLADVADLKAEFADAATWALEHQRADGLWGCYLDDDATPPDTSGSAGIAAAFARGVRAGLLPREVFVPASIRCRDALSAHLTPDGFLGGAAQSNRGGEALQRAPYRVLSPMAMGLMGQLVAALNLVSHGDAFSSPDADS
jgi:Predicted unsaturated glucuronyl hydrolase involved in regulation of bacterial surface properties, and related proteins